MVSGNKADKKNSVQVDAHLKNEAGWTSKIMPLHPGMSAQVSSSQNEFYILARTLDEYFIIENRQQIDRDAALDASGLAVWRG